MAAAEGQLLAPRKTNAEETPLRRAGGGPEAEDKTSRDEGLACCNGRVVKKRTNAEVKDYEDVNELYYKDGGVKGAGKKGGDPNVSRPQTPHEKEAPSACVL